MMSPVFKVSRGRGRTESTGVCCVDSCRIREPGRGSQAVEAQIGGTALGPQAKVTKHRHSREAPS